MIDLRCGDARTVLATLPDACCDALVSDPPAGISFMNLAFDGNRGGRDQWIAWLAGIMAEARRCLRPGGYALVWALPRTSHWTGMALEEAGFQLRDQISHLFATGFPKSHSCLKPAHEVWWLAKAPGPLQPLQIDAARVRTAELSRPSGVRRARPSPGIYGDDPGGNRKHSGNGANDVGGRWPANTLLSHHPDCQPAGVRRVPADKRGQGRPRGTFPHSDDAWGNGHRAYTGAETAGDGTEAQQDYLCVGGCPVAALDRQAGPRTSGGYPPQGVQRSHVATYGRPNERGEQRFTSSTGSASRYFPTFPGPAPQDAAPFRYQPKASRRDRGEGNTHNTVKSTALMAWLCKLATPRGGVVLDCFAGSGSTGVACVREGFGFIGIEQDATYVEIMRARIAHEQERADGQLALPLGHACG